MTEAGETTTWTGLAASSWGALGGDEPQEDYAHLLQLLRARGGRTLDVGCGTGRLLVRFLREGLDVHGVDTSPEMLELCRAKAGAAGLRASLFRQSMERLELGDSYRTVLLPCGSFMLLPDDERAIGALRCLGARLEPGGLLWLNVFGPSRPPSPTLGHWQPRGEGELQDGSTVSMEILVEDYDEVHRLVRSRRRYTRRRADEVLAEELLEDVYRWHAPDHVLALLAAAGFGEVTVEGDYDGGPVGPGSAVAVFKARR